MVCVGWASDRRHLRPPRRSGLEAPLPVLVVHELRHTHATLLLRAGVPVHVAKRLGHKDPSVTLNVYADVIPEDDASAVDAFRTAVWGASVSMYPRCQVLADS